MVKLAHKLLNTNVLFIADLIGIQQTEHCSAVHFKFKILCR